MKKGRHSCTALGDALSPAWHAGLVPSDEVVQAADVLKVRV
ncbi:MAG TPA: hypothetical protein VII95_21220 [Terriglobales bacterium]